MGGRSGQARLAGEAGRGRRGPRGRGAAGPTADAVEASPDRGRRLGGSFGRVSRMHPGPVAVVRLQRPGRSRRSTKARTAVRVDPASERSAHDSAFWTSGSSSPMSSSTRSRPCAATSGVRPRRWSTNGSVATVEPTSRRSQRDGENTRPSSSAQRYGSRMIPRPTGWARLSTVIQSPASRAARRRSCQARSGSSGRSRSSSLKANQRGSSSGSANRRSAISRKPDVPARAASRPGSPARRRPSAASARRTCARCPARSAAAPAR